MKTQSNIRNNQVQNLNPASTRSATHSGVRLRQGKTLPRIDFALRRSNQFLTTEQLLNVLKREAPRFFAASQVVGKWVWVRFSQPQPRPVTQLLAQLGFWWSKRRGAWMHPCGVFSQNISTGDPRQVYGVWYPAQQRPNA